MKKLSLGQTITILANVGVIAGIVFLGVELRQNSEAAELQAAQSYVNLTQELDFRIVDDPSLIALFLTSPESRSPVESVRMDRWIFGVLRTWENGHYLHSRGVLDDELWLGQEAFMADLLRRNDEQRNYYQANRAYFSESFTEFLDGLLEVGSE